MTNKVEISIFFSYPQPRFFVIKVSIVNVV